MAKKSKAKAAKKTAKKSRATKKPAKPAARAARKTSRGATRKVTRATSKATKKGAKKAAKKKKVSKSSAAPKRRPSAAVRAAVSKRPNLDRERRTIREEEELFPSPPSSLDMNRTASAARTGRAEYEQKLREHTSTGPAMTGGDVDADWEDAESVGDEAPGGDNPTPDQDVVEEIGRAIGIEYEDDEELQGGDELTERDRHRWELDPRSKDDFDEE